MPPSANRNAPDSAAGVDLASELGLHERILRRACGAPSEAAALESVAAELYPLVRHRWAWVASVDGARARAEITALWPGHEAAGCLPRMMPLGEGLTAAALAPSPGVYCGGCPPGDPYDQAVRAFGARSHITLGLPSVSGEDRLVTFASPAAPEHGAERRALVARLAPTVAAAFALTDTRPQAGTRSTWGGLDPVEIVDYVCRAVAHDVRNIMAGIIGAVELRREDISQEDGPLFEAVRRRAVEGVAMAEAMRARLDRLVRVQGSRVCLLEIGQQVVGLLRPTLGSLYGSQAPTVTCSGAAAAVLAEAGELRRAVSALVFNAVRAAGRGGQARVEVFPERRRAVLEVLDDGPGMTEEAHRRAKEPFYTTGSGESLGLGLTIAEGVARRFGGSVAVRSHSGRGTRVALMLPLADELVA